MDLPHRLMLITHRPKGVPCPPTPLVTFGSASFFFFSLLAWGFTAQLESAQKETLAFLDLCTEELLLPGSLLLVRWGPQTSHFGTAWELVRKA